MITFRYICLLNCTRSTKAPSKNICTLSMCLLVVRWGKCCDAQLGLCVECRFSRGFFCFSSILKGEVLTSSRFGQIVEFLSIFLPDNTMNVYF